MRCLFYRRRLTVIVGFCSKSPLVIAAVYLPIRVPAFKKPNILPDHSTCQGVCPPMRRQVLKPISRFALRPNPLVLCGIQHYPIRPVVFPVCWPIDRRPAERRHTGEDGNASKRPMSLCPDRESVRTKLLLDFGRICFFACYVGYIFKIVGRTFGC